MEHPALKRISRECFTPLAWFSCADMGDVRFVLMIGNAGPGMFERFTRESQNTLDEWTRGVVTPLAAELGAKAVFPFDKPHLPFLTWARRGGAGHVSPLGLNIHPIYGLWHAYRAALLFPVQFDLPVVSNGERPCDRCTDKPCLSACPVSAFDANRYDVAACGAHLKTPSGEDCMQGGCLARRACPVGTQYQYHPEQAQFHMKAFRELR